MRWASSRSVVLLLASLELLLACGRGSKPTPPPATPEVVGSGCPSDRFVYGVMPAARDASEECRGGDVARCREDCDRGLAFGCIELAWAHEAEKDTASAARAHRRGCELGATIGCTNLGAMIVNGVGDTGLTASCAVALFDVACATAERFGCGMLGVALVRGRGVTKDVGRGRDLLERSCDKLGGFPCHALGVLVLDGAFGPVDHPAARRALSRGCETGHVESCKLLASPHAGEKF